MDEEPTLGIARRTPVRVVEGLDGAFGACIDAVQRDEGLLRHASVCLRHPAFERARWGHVPDRRVVLVRAQHLERSVGDQGHVGRRRGSRGHPEPGASVVIDVARHLHRLAPDREGDRGEGSTSRGGTALRIADEHLSWRPGSQRVREVDLGLFVTTVKRQRVRRMEAARRGPDAKLDVRALVGPALEAAHVVGPIGDP